MKYIVFLIMILSVSGLNAQTKKEKKSAKKAAEEKVHAEVKSLLESMDFTFTADWANPLGGQRINLINNPNSMIFSENLIEADLPYFGVAQMASYGGNTGMDFKIENPEIQKEFNEKKEKYLFRFTGKNNTEVLNCMLTVFKNKNASLNVQSSNRNSINYDGRISETVKPENN